MNMPNETVIILKYLFWNLAYLMTFIDSLVKSENYKGKTNSFLVQKFGNCLFQSPSKCLFSEPPQKQNSWSFVLFDMLHVIVICFVDGRLGMEIISFHIQSNLL